MTSAVVYQQDSMLPWDEFPEDRSRTRRILGIALILALLVSIAIPFITVPKQDRREAAVIPERIARVVERKIELPPPPPPKPKQEEKKKEEKPDQPKAEKPAEKPVDKPIRSEIKPDAKPVEVQAARDKAAKVLQDSGLDDLASLRDFAPATPSVTPGGGSSALQTSAGEAAGTSRNMLTSKGGSGSGSGGLAAAGYGGNVSSGFGGGVAGGKGKGEFGLKGGKTAEVQSGIAAAGQGAGGAREKGSDGKSRRSGEEIRRTFDQYGARIYSAYQRALREDPTLQGTVSIKLTVAPDGSVTNCSIGASQLNNSELEGKLLAIVRGMNFGAAEVEVWNGSHNLNLLPN